MRKKIIMYVFILFLLLIPNAVKADCSGEEVTRLSRLAHNINVSIQFDEITKDFSITFLNMTSDFLIQHENNGEVFESHYELVLDHVESGNHIFTIHDTSGCYSNEIVTKSVYVPYYNKYYNSKECQKIKNYVYCAKWLKSELTYNTWKNKVDSYMQKDRRIIFDDEEVKEKTTGDYIVEFFVTLYVEHYYVFLPIIIISFVAIIYLKNKSEQIIYRKNKGEDITL